ncbi:MAG: MFS transporter [Pseudomonadota bacterium]|nr:MFS transporter [Pseudomonadota bacterium]
MAGSTGATNPIAVIDDNPMGVRQWIIVILMVLLNALDGFDVLSSAFAAPGIMMEWGVDRPALGVMLSAELWGMGFGSVLLGGMADRLGRRPTLLTCLVIMTLGMFLAGTAQSLWPLTGWRFLTGLGIGGMLAATNAVTAEVTSRSQRALAIGWYVIGYPLGAVVGGLVASNWLMIDYGWRSVFYFGSVTTAIMIPLVLWLVPETPAFLASVRPPGALEKINKALTTFKQRAVTVLPTLARVTKPKITDILARRDLRKVTLILAFGYMCHTLTFYYILKWAPTILAGLGYTGAQPGNSLVVANIGGAIGGALFGFLMKKWDIKVPTMIALALGSVAVATFGITRQSIWGWYVATFLCGFFTNAAIVGFYAAFARGFPAYARATGTGFALGVGRAGAAGSPPLAGYLFGVLGNEALLTVSTVMALGSILAMILLWWLPVRDADRDLEEGAAN